jgi:hypothetical protein
LSGGDCRENKGKGVAKADVLLEYDREVVANGAIFRGFRSMYLTIRIQSAGATNLIPHICCIYLYLKLAVGKHRARCI